MLPAFTKCKLATPKATVKKKSYEDVNDLLLDICGVIMYKQGNSNCFEIAEEEKDDEGEGGEEGEEIMVEKPRFSCGSESESGSEIDCEDLPEFMPSLKQCVSMQPPPCFNKSESMGYLSPILLTKQKSVPQEVPFNPELWKQRNFQAKNRKEIRAFTVFVQERNTHLRNIVEKTIYFLEN